MQREAEAFELSARGWSNRKIARHMGLSHEGVNKILDRVQTRESARFSKRWLNVKMKQYHRLEWVIEECSEAWEQSKQPGRRVRQGEDGSTVTEAFEREGNVAYIDRISKAMEQQARILGLNVADATQEIGAGIAQLTEDMRKRGEEYDARKSAEASPVDPGGLPPGPGGGAQEVQEGPGPVQ